MDLVKLETWAWAAISCIVLIEVKVIGTWLLLLLLLLRVVVVLSEEIVILRWLILLHVVLS